MARRREQSKRGVRRQSTVSRIRLRNKPVGDGAVACRRVGDTFLQAGLELVDPAIVGLSVAQLLETAAFFCRSSVEVTCVVHRTVCVVELCSSNVDLILVWCRGIVSRGRISK